jgi:hypothetical protein
VCSTASSRIDAMEKTLAQDELARYRVPIRGSLVAASIIHGFTRREARCRYRIHRRRGATIYAVPRKHESGERVWQPVRAGDVRAALV